MATPNNLLSGIFSTPEMDRIFGDSERVQCMLRFEAALAIALERFGLAPAGTAEPLLALSKTEFLTTERAEVLRKAASNSGNIAIPFVTLLTEIVQDMHAEAAGVIHMGATSQDVIDNSLVLQLREALTILLRDLTELIDNCAVLASLHIDTVMAGRTWLQQGPPITFGLKVAGWAAALSRHRSRLKQLSGNALTLQFGGAVGTLASLGDRGIEVSSAVASELELTEPSIPWHTHRDNFAEVATTLGLLAGSLGKIARDISLLMQTEVSEIREGAGEGRGGSSTMPHKRNPVGSAAIIAASLQIPGLVSTMLSAMPQEHERAVGGWQAEWETLPQIFRLVGASLAQAKELVYSLEVSRERMIENLSATQGVILAEAVSAALAKHIGRASAYRLLEEKSMEALRTRSSLIDVLRKDAKVTQYLSEETLTLLLDPTNYLGSAIAFVNRTLASLAREN